MQKKIAVPKQELEIRWKKVQKELTHYDLDALFIPLGVNFYYLFGKEGQPSERLIAGIISRDNDPFIISPKFEKTNIGTSTYIDDISVWEETESPYKLVAKELRDRKIGSNIGVDPKLWILEVEKLVNATNGIFKSSEYLLNGLRSIKSPWEIEQLKNAAQISSDAIHDSTPELKIGITERQFLKIVQNELSKRSGSPAAFGIVQFGENSAIPHGPVTDRKLNNDEVILVDAGCTVNGYKGDITITTPFGKPKDFDKIYDIVLEANRKAFDSEKEGTIPSNLDSIARQHISNKGYGEFFTHRLGHGLGLEVHEAPYIVASNDDPLKIGNCHTIEPGIYVPGKFGIRIEDNVVVIKDGSMLLNHTKR